MCGHPIVWLGDTAGRVKAGTSRGYLIFITVVKISSRGGHGHEQIVVRKRGQDSWILGVLSPFSHTRYFFGASRIGSRRTNTRVPRSGMRSVCGTNERSSIPFGLLMGRSSTAVATFEMVMIAPSPLAR